MSDTTQVLFVVFVVLLSLVLVWVGREFIRSLRERRSQGGAEPSVAEGGPATAEDSASAEPEPAAEAQPEGEAVGEAQEAAPSETAAGEDAPAPAAAEELKTAEAERAEPQDQATVDRAEAEGGKGPEPADTAVSEAAEPAPAGEEGAREPAAEGAPAEAPAEPKPAAEPEPAVAEPVPKPPPPVARVSKVEARQRLVKGLAKTRGGFVAKLGRLFRGKKELDADLVERLEEVLFTADIGVKTSEKLFELLKEQLDRKALQDTQAVWAFLKETAREILDVPAEPWDLDANKPFVILTIGVNGVGKTTTIGKLAAQFAAEGKSVVMAAGDTFRAAATEQLEVWARRTGADLVKGKPKADPASVIFDAVKLAEREAKDVVIADTAGRLHTKVALMDELKKVHRVIGKAKPGAPHETLLILDATTGQNALQQARMFAEAVKFTGVVLTKMDGTAKGGIILGVCDELKVPVRYIGIGERIEDLRPFDPQEFVEALFEASEGA